MRSLKIVRLPAIFKRRLKTKHVASIAANDNDAARVDGAALLDDLAAAFRRHIVLPAGAAEVMALWTVFAHSFPAHDYSPRLAFTSPEPECGKTTALKILEALCPRLPSYKRKADVSESYIFHVTDKAAREHMPFTLILDECDNFLRDKPTLKGVLNAGFEPGSSVGRCAKDDKGNYVPREYSIDTPVALAGIGDSWLWDTLRSRSIVIPMRRPRRDEGYEKWSLRRDGAGLQILADRAAAWAKWNLGALMNTDKPKMPDALRGRAADKWEPLIALADVAGGHWPQTARRVALAMSGAPRLTDGQQVLAAIRDVFSGVDRLSSDDLCAGLNKGIDQWSATATVWEPMTLAAALKDYGIEPKVIRIGDKTPRGYMRAWFADAWERYCDGQRRAA
jgi:hypothetical protein